MKLGEIIKELLEQGNITQKQLAERLDISPSALGNYIQCRREPDYETLIRIADFFQVTVDFLLNHNVTSKLSYSEEQLIHIFRALSEEQKEFYLEQGKIFIRLNNKKEANISKESSQNKSDII